MDMYTQKVVRYKHYHLLIVEFKNKNYYKRYDYVSSDYSLSNKYGFKDWREEIKILAMNCDSIPGPGRHIVP